MTRYQETRIKLLPVPKGFHFRSDQNTVTSPDFKRNTDLINFGHLFNNWYPDADEDTSKTFMSAQLCLKSKFTSEINNEKKIDF